MITKSLNKLEGQYLRRKSGKRINNRKISVILGCLVLFALELVDELRT